MSVWNCCTILLIGTMSHLRLTEYLQRSCLVFLFFRRLHAAFPQTPTLDLFHCRSQFPFGVDVQIVRTQAPVTVSPSFTRGTAFRDPVQALFYHWSWVTYPWTQRPSKCPGQSRPAFRSPHCPASARGAV